VEASASIFSGRDREEVKICSEAEDGRGYCEGLSINCYSDAGIAQLHLNVCGVDSEVLKAAGSTIIIVRRGTCQASRRPFEQMFPQASPNAHAFGRQRTGCDRTQLALEYSYSWQYFLQVATGVQSAIGFATGRPIASTDGPAPIDGGFPNLQSHLDTSIAESRQLYAWHSKRPRTFVFRCDEGRRGAAGGERWPVTEEHADRLNGGAVNTG
jgi:hypothetical protein